jgi:hypothetical protein
MIGDLLYIAGYYVEGGIREFGKWSKALINRFGKGGPSLGRSRKPFEKTPIEQSTKPSEPLSEEQMQQVFREVAESLQDDQRLRRELLLEEYRRIEARIRESRRTPEMVLIAAARAQGAGLHKTTFWLAMKRAGVPRDQIERAVRATWEATHAETPESELRKHPPESRLPRRPTVEEQRLMYLCPVDSPEELELVMSSPLSKEWLAQQNLEDRKALQERYDNLKFEDRNFPPVYLESRPPVRPTVEERRLMVLCGVKSLEELEQAMSSPLSEEWLASQDWELRRALEEWYDRLEREEKGD